MCLVFWVAVVGDSLTSFLGMLHQILKLTIGFTLMNGIILWIFHCFYLLSSVIKHASDWFQPSNHDPCILAMFFSVYKTENIYFYPYISSFVAEAEIIKFICLQRQLLVTLIVTLLYQCILQAR